MKTFFAFFAFAAALAAQSVTIGAPVFAGAGLNDAASGGQFSTLPTNATYAVTISATGTPDTFTWTKNAGTPSSGIAITGAAQALADGVTIKFAATTGHTLADAWTISANARGSLAGTNTIGAGVGAVMRTGESKTREVVSVTDFGAVADGTSAGTTGTSQTARFQNAVNALAAAGGGALFVPYAGQAPFITKPLCYELAYPGVQLTSNITVYSDSRETCIQALAANATSWPGGWAMFSNSSTLTGLSNIHLRSLTLDANSANITGLSNSIPVLNVFGAAFYGVSGGSIENATIKNGAGDAAYVDCANAGAGNLVQGIGFAIRGSLLTGSQRNNISIVCGTNVRIEDNEISFASGTSPQAGVDIEENGAGQAIPGLIIARNNVHDNVKQGLLVQPAHDAAGTFFGQVIDNDSYGNGAQGLQVTGFATGNTVSVVGGSYHGNTGVQILMQSWLSPVVAGVTAVGGPVGLSIGSGVTNASVSGRFSGSAYDLEISDPSSTANTGSLSLDHGTVNGRQYFSGSLGNVIGVSTSDINGANNSLLTLLPSVSVANGNNYVVHDGILGSGASLTAQRGFACDDLTIGTYNICFQSNVSAGANKYSMYHAGTAAAYLGGALTTVGPITAPSISTTTPACTGHASTVNNICTGSGCSVLINLTFISSVTCP